MLPFSVQVKLFEQLQPPQVGMLRPWYSGSVVV